jgi:general secretion pathway protein F
MPLYRFKAVTEAGEVVEGDLEAADQAAVISLLRSRGQLPIRAEEQRPGGLAAWFNRELQRRNRLSHAELTMLIQELAMLLRAGLPIDQTLEVCITYAEKPAVRAVVKRLRDDVRGGKSLADAMAAQEDTFDRFAIGMVRAGEASGALDTVLAKTAEFMERSQKSRASFRSALIYPAILLVSAIISVGIIITVVIPSFKEIFDEAGFPLPLATRVVMAIGQVAQGYWWVPVVVVLLAVVWIARERRSDAGRLAWDARLLKLPLLGPLLTSAQVARVTFTLGMLLSNGVPLMAALGVARETLSNAVFVTAFEGVQKHVKEGKTFARPLTETGVFPALATHLLRVGEESGRLEDMLFRVAETYDQELQRGLQRLLTLLTPAITLLMALMIAGIIVSILLPMLSIGDLAM